MKGYVFISNSNKPTKEQRMSREDAKISNVSKPCLLAALKLGYNVFLGVNRDNPQNIKCELPIKMYDSHTYRSITNFKDNLVAYNNLKEVVKSNNIEVIHCNTPIGGIIGRLVGKRYKINKVIYTAHGFHFYKGAPILNRTVFKLAEKIMARRTDAIITMNEEDYQAAKKFKLKKNGKVFKVHGVGIDLNQINRVEVSKLDKRKELGLNESDLILISAGRLDKGKNYISAIKAISKLKRTDLHYLICGVGPDENRLKKLCEEYGVLNRVHFLGFRDDIIELMKISDIFLFTSFREGLPRVTMEAMATGLPCIVSKIRGNSDLIEDKKGGYLCNPNDIEIISKKINFLCNNEKVRYSMGNYNLKSIKNYDVSVVKKEIEYIYIQVLQNN